VQRLTDHSLTAYEDQQRHGVQALGLRLLRSHPLGIGYGNFSLYEPPSLYFSNGLPDFHDQETFFQIGLDSGWLGLAGFCVIGVAAFSRLGRLRADPLVMAGTAGLAGLAAQGLNDYVIYDVPLLMATGFMLMLAFGNPESVVATTSGRITFRRRQPSPGSSNVSGSASGKTSQQFVVAVEPSRSSMSLSPRGGNSP
jgi:hypothetical protein